MIYYALCISFPDISPTPSEAAVETDAVPPAAVADVEPDDAPPKEEADIPAEEVLPPAADILAKFEEFIVSLLID